MRVIVKKILDYKVISRMINSRKADSIVLGLGGVVEFLEKSIDFTLVFSNVI